MSDSKKRRIEFGDFQTPEALALSVCNRLHHLGIRPDVVIEPTCGVGAFVKAAAQVFSEAEQIYGFEINHEYLAILKEQLRKLPNNERIQLEQADFFGTNWAEKLAHLTGTKLVIGNFPWVTNAGQGLIGGTNLPEKSNFQGHSGFDAISGKANFDISEWMLLDVLRWFTGAQGDIAMLVKTAVARKVLAHAEKQKYCVREAFLIGINAKKEFDASVDACLLVIRLSADKYAPTYDYVVYDDLDDAHGRRVGHRMGLTIGDLDAFSEWSHLIGSSPQKWRSGIKHDASAIMEFTPASNALENGLGEVVDLEKNYLFPLLKGSDVGSGKPWRGKYTLVTQRRVGEDTGPIRDVAPNTWSYLESHGAQLDARGSSIYRKNPRFSIFGVGDYAFRPWKIAICALYKSLRFRLVGPIEGKPVMFDDTVYYVSFDSEQEALNVLKRLESAGARALLSSLIFWDEKRPIKTSILNVFDWSKLEQDEARQAA